MSSNVHPMTKKGIKNFIKKNNLDEIYINKIDSIKDINELYSFNESIKENQNDLYNYIYSKIKDKVPTNKTKNPSDYLMFDIAVINKIIDKNSVTLNDKNLNSLIENGKNKEVFKIIKSLREERTNILNINAYCLDNLAKLASMVLKNINLLKSDTCKRSEFIEMLSLTNTIDILQPILFDYFAMNVDKTKLNDEQIDYIFKYIRNNNVKKNIFDAREIKTVKNFTDKIVSIFKELLKGDKNHLLDLYSISKVFELFLVLV